jgi:uncharacterized protein
MQNRSSIDACLALKRVAVIGVSRAPRDFSRLLFREFVKRGYDAVPVNRNTAEIEGRRCCAAVSEVVPAAEWALIMTAPDGAAAAVRECADAGIRRVWLYRATGQGAATEEALRACADRAVEVADGCPFMFFRAPGFPHNIHAVLLKLLGRYPRAAC